MCSIEEEHASVAGLYFPATVVKIKSPRKSMPERGSPEPDRFCTVSALGLKLYHKMGSHVLVSISSECLMFRLEWHEVKMFGGYIILY